MVYVIGGIVLIGAFVFFMYSTLNHRKSEADMIVEQIENEVNQKYSIMYDLINKFKDSLIFEREHFEELYDLIDDSKRALNLFEKEEIEKRISDKFAEIFSFIDDFPELKEDGEIQSEKKKLTEMEHEISGLKERYNKIVSQYNNIIEMFPILFEVFGRYKKKEKFSLKNDADGFDISEMLNG